jgi:putative ABC transport system permease protein
MIATRLWIRLASVLVPWDERVEWIEEWDAELEATGQGMTHALGSISDAWYLRTEGWTMEGMLRDIRMAVRTMIRKPFFTALAGITLAIGIGANTAIFSVVDGVLINPLPFPEAHRLLSVNHTAPPINIPILPHSEGMYLHYHEHFRTLESFAVFGGGTVDLITDGDPQRISGASVTEDFFAVLGVSPMLGRGFAEGEDRVGAEPVAILSYGLWQQSFGSDRDVVGQVVEMDGVHRRVVGVMPDGFVFPEEAQLWTPMQIDGAAPEMGSIGLLGIGRLAEGQTLEAAQAELQDLLFLFSDTYPDEFSREILEQTGTVQDVKPLKDLYVEDVEQALWVLLGTVGFVLLIACANVANLFLVRAESRQREQALKTALGASRADIVRQYLTESLTLAVGGGLLGLILAYLGMKGLLAMAPVAVPRADEIGIDGSVLLFTAAISLGSGLLFGLFPALGQGGKDLSGALKEGGRNSTTGRERHKARNLLVIAQVALALVLLVGSGLMARSFLELRGVDPGFDSENRLVYRIGLPDAEWSEPEAVRAFHRQLQERMAAIPGVRSAALVTAAPLEDQKTAGPMETDENPVQEGELGTLVDRRHVSPGYFRTLGIELVAGRELTWEDGGDTFRGIIVSEALARAFWPGEASVLGKQIREQGSEDGFWEVVGVAQDVRFENLTSDPAPLAYVPMTTGGHHDPDPVRAMAVVLHTDSDPLGAVALAREALREVGPRLPMVNPRTLETIEKNAMAATSFTVVLLGIASGIALLLGTVGIYGVVSYVVSRRTQEIGVRMALGAPGSVVLRDVVRQGMILTGVGIGIGLLGAWGVSRVLATLLFGVSATDPLTYLGTASGLAMVAFMASWIPARRAARIDPVEALRSE